MKPELFPSGEATSFKGTNWISVMPLFQKTDTMLLTCSFQRKTLWLSILVFLLSCAVGMGQDNNILGDITPTTPNAASLGEYSDIPVGHHTGVPSISVPIYTISDGPVSLPISLSYHASGVRVEELASWVGLGWSLNAGGMISRTVRNAPDEGRPGTSDTGFYEGFGNPSSNWNDLNTYFDLANKGLIDTEPDLFTFNFAGYSGKFLFDEDRNVLLTPDQDLKVEVFWSNKKFNYWVITTPDGMRFYFGGTGPNGVEAVEIIEAQKDAGSATPRSVVVPAAWYLTKVETPKGPQTIHLEYIQEKYQYANIAFQSVDILSSSYTSTTPTCTSIPPNGNRINTTVTGCRLSRIFSQYHQVLFHANTPREDLVNVYNTNNLNLIEISSATGACLKKFQLSASYFESTTGPTNSSDSKRLRLDAVTEQSCTGESLPPYSFSYYYQGYEDNQGQAITGKLPHRLSLAQDHWGYYNGENGNQNLIPSFTINTWNGISVCSQGTANREPSFPEMLFGALTSVTYPTGGKVQFDFEPHVVLTPNNNLFFLSALSYLLPDTNNVCNIETDSGVPISTGTAMSNVSIRLALRKDALVNPYDFSNNPGCYPEIKAFLDGNQIGSVVINVNDPDPNFKEAYINIPSLLPGQVISIEVAGGEGALSFYTNELGEKMGGGIRVSRVAIDPVSGDPPIVKEYKYPEFGLDGEPNGIILAQPVYLLDIRGEGLKLYDGVSNTNGGALCRPIVYKVSSSSIAPMRSTQGSNVGYKLVEEHLPGNGKTVFRYYLKSYPPNLYDYDYPTPPQEFHDEMNGKMIEKFVYAEGGNTPLEYEKYDYQRSSAGLALGKAVSGPGNTPCHVNKWLTTNYGITIEKILLLSKEQASFFPSGEVRTTHTYSYGSNHNFPVSEEFLNSDGKLHRTEYKYAHEAGHSLLIDNYMIGIPVEVKNMINGNTATGTKTDYSLINGWVLPQRSYIWEDGWENVLTVESYTLDGYPEIVQRREFPDKEYYTWENGLLKSKRYLEWVNIWDYYPDSRLLREQVEIDGQSTQHYYDQFLRVDSITTRDNKVTTNYSYLIGGPNQVISSSSYTDAPTQVVVNEFDGIGRATKTSHNGVTKNSIFYDGAGRVARKMYLTGSFTIFDYEPSPLGRLTRETFPDNNFITHIYDGEDNYFKKTTLDEKQNPSHVLTDFLGRQGLIRDALGGKTVFQYGNGGDLESITAPNGGQYLYTYDEGHRLLSKSVPGKGKQIFRYYPVNKLLRYSIDANGNRLDYTYDEYIREKLVRLAKINNWDPSDPNASHGSPGDRILEYAYGESTSEQANFGKMKWSDVKVLDGTDFNFVKSEFNYDQYGRMEQLVEKHPLGEDTYKYTYNLADWLRFEDRSHIGPEIFDMRTTRLYDRFGREIAYMMQVGTVPDGFRFGRAYNVRDQITGKYYDSLDPYSPLDKVKLKYNTRGWVTDMNDIFYDELTADEC
ncbi:MAG: RHS repeat protein, partial [Phaeodactylibacter sp.]|nr:RHS repeat protein [Phaeodactylibacter sp.]